jgi:hypothetical protein
MLLEGNKMGLGLQTGNGMELWTAFSPAKFHTFWGE